MQACHVLPCYLVSFRRSYWNSQFFMGNLLVQNYPNLRLELQIDPFHLRLPAVNQPPVDAGHMVPGNKWMDLFRLKARQDASSRAKHTTNPTHFFCCSFWCISWSKGSTLYMQPVCSSGACRANRFTTEFVLHNSSFLMGKEEFQPLHAPCLCKHGKSRRWSPCTKSSQQIVHCTCGRRWRPYKAHSKFERFSKND